MANIEGKAQVAISFDGRDPNITSPQGIHYLWAIENRMLIAPVLRMALYDDGVITNPSPGDGSLIEITMGREKNDSRTYRFRMVGAPRTDSVIDRDGKHRNVIIYEAVFDAPRLYFETANFAFRGTSSEAIDAITSELGLPAIIHSSNSDSMVWQSGQSKWSAFMARVASRGWFGEDSAASPVCIGLDGIVRYLDLAKVVKLPPRHTFYYMTPMPPVSERDDTLAYNAYYMSREDKVSVSTALTGYSATAKYFDRNGELIKHDKANVTRQSNQLNMSAEVRDAIKVGAQRVRPTLSPNVHAEYERALYQNSRYHSTYNTLVNVMLLEMTKGLSLMTPAAVISTFYGAGATDDTLRSVRGLVGARAVGIASMNYIEKVVLMTQGTDATNMTSKQV